jgi:hypothetical protein
VTNYKRRHRPGSQDLPSVRVKILKETRLYVQGNSTTQQPSSCLLYNQSQTVPNAA